MNSTLVFRLILIVALIVASVDLRASEDQQTQVKTGEFKEISIPAKLSIEGFKLLFAPVYTSFKIIKGFQDDESLIENTKQAAPYLAGYIALRVIKNKVIHTYFVQTSNQFLVEATRDEPSRSKVLFINAATHADNQVAIQEALFLHNHPASQYQRFSVDAHTREISPLDTFNGAKPQKKAYYVKVASTNELSAFLTTIKQNSQFDRIIIRGHGQPGKLRVGEIDRVGASFWELLSHSHLDITTPGADIIIHSCSFGGKKICGPDVGKEATEAIGRALLPNGGTIYSSPKSIQYEVPAKGGKLFKIQKGLQNELSEITSLSIFSQPIERALGSSPTTKTITKVKIAPHDKDKCIEKVLSESP